MRPEYLRSVVGDELAGVAERVRAIWNTPGFRARNKRNSLRAYIGPTYYSVLIGIVKEGFLSAAGGPDRHDAIRRGVDALALAKEWEEECERWGLL
jgi:hypothetical protein